MTAELGSVHRKAMHHKNAHIRKGVNAARNNVVPFLLGGSGANSG
jgi:hypothetical protein